MTLTGRLRDLGLSVCGLLELGVGECDAYRLPGKGRRLALIGNIGSSYWPIFSASSEYRDGLPDPLDRWSRRVAEGLARDFELHAIYPFEGPPYYPFQQWAGRAEGLTASPLGIRMHSEYGLWHSYRFALLGIDADTESRMPSAASPCLGCSDRPCLRTCPVDAFSESGYDTDRCAGYLQRTPDAGCHAGGCMARLACPVAPGLRYVPEQGAFHLRAFLAARD